MPRSRLASAWWLYFGVLFAGSAACSWVGNAPGSSSSHPSSGSGTGTAKGGHPSTGGQQNPGKNSSQGDVRRFVQVANGARHTCALRQGGDVWCWGANDRGQLAGGPGNLRDRPGAVAGLPPIAELGSGVGHTCARTRQGEVYCWGDNQQGQLGEGDGTAGAASSRPVRVRLGVDARHLAVGDAHACVVGTDANVYCWGDNRSSQTSAGGGVVRRLPERINGLRNTVELALGRAHSCARDREGDVACWGGNNDHQLGFGGEATIKSPRQVPAIRGAKRLEAGGDRTCVWSGQAVYCWGREPGGRVNAPQRVFGVGDLVDLSVQAGHACLVRQSGQAYCWGVNTDGRLGTGTVQAAETPSAVAQVRDFMQVSTGFSHTCGVRRTGTLACWGSDATGALGAGKSAAQTRDGAALVAMEELPRDLANGTDFTCAVGESGQVWCWGDNRQGQGGSGSREAAQPLPRRVQGIDDARVVAAGTAHACAVLRSGKVRCWGQNKAHQLGAKASSESHAMIDVPRLNDAVSVAAGDRHTCALRQGGQVMCWGGNDRGQRGSSDASGTVVGLRDVVEIAAGGQHTCARQRSGLVYCWGDNSQGQIGNNSGATDLHMPVSTPAQVARLTDAQQVVAGKAFSCVRTSTGKASCWGGNRERELGSGTQSDVWLMPVPVQGLPSIHTLAAGEAHACAADRGVVRCWGRRGPHLRPDQGKGEPVNQASAGPSLAVRKLSAGQDHTCAILSDGGAACWGVNDRGQLGAATRGIAVVPQSVVTGNR